MRNTSLATAMHEAGHAVIKMALGGPAVRSVSIIDQRDGQLGYCEADARFCHAFTQIRLPDDPEQAALIREHWIKAAWDDVLDTLAGPIAEMRWRRVGHWGVVFSGEANRRHCLGEPEPPEGTDWWQVHYRLRWAYPDDPEGAFTRAWAETADLVAKHWWRIERVGRRLHAKGRLESDELCELASL